MDKTIVLDVGDTLTVVDGDSRHNLKVCRITLFEDDVDIETYYCYQLKHTKKDEVSS